MTVISRALASQWRVLHALMMREVKSRFGKMKLGYLWAFIEPLLFIGFFAVLWGVFRGTPGGLPLLSFLVTGFGSFLFFRNVMSYTSMSIRINRSLMTYPQVTPFGLVVARALLEIATLTVVYAGLLIAAQSLEQDVRMENPLLLALVLLLMATTGLGLGLIVSTIVPIFPSMQQIIEAAVSRPAFLLSGTFFYAGMMPEDIRQYLLFNPLLHGTEIARSATFGRAHDWYGDLSYLATWAVALLLFGLLFQRAMRKRLYQIL